MHDKFVHVVTLPWPVEWNWRFSGMIAPPDDLIWWLPWLEEHVGQQGVDWDWDVSWSFDNRVAVGFIEESNLVWFKLFWDI